MLKRIAHHKRVAIPRSDGAFDIPVGHGRFAIVDAEDVPVAIKYTWSARGKAPGIYYVWSHVRIGKIRKEISLARLLLNAPSGLQVDHIDRNPLNNRRANLRLASVWQNNANKRTRPSNTGLIGVRKLASGRYQAHVISTMGNGYKYSQSFASLQEAAYARDAIAKQIWGDFARLNFPEGNANV